MTVIQALTRSIQAAAHYNSAENAAPTAIIWTDEQSAWLPILPQLRSLLPIFTLGEYKPDQQQGPDSYIRYQLGSGHGQTSVIYLPGVSRSAFRSAQDMTASAKHLYGLQFEGQFWIQKSHRDWTPLAFLQSEHGGLKLEVAQDADTREALSLALPELMERDVESLRSGKLEAVDFRTLSSPDPIKDILLWVNAPADLASWPEAKQKNFTATCKADYALDPDADGPITAAQRIAEKDGAWLQVWERFCEAPSRYPGVIGMMEKVQPDNQDLFLDKSSWLPLNNEAEKSLASSLSDFAQLPHDDACKKIAKLHQEHGNRSDWVWAELGKAPLACALTHLARIADLVKESYHFATWDELAAYYRSTGYQIDLAATEALRLAGDKSTTAALHAAIRALYLPWMEDLSLHCQNLSASYPVLDKSRHRTLDLKPGTIFVFVDGLRYDLATTLATELKRSGKNPELDQEWAALPSVTSTAKPAWNPMSLHVEGNFANPDFSPSTPDGKELTTARFRKNLEVLNIQFIPSDEMGDPKGCGWTECADIDSLGHKEGWKMAKQLPAQVEIISERIQELCDAGWQRVEILTDHGWLLLAGDLEREEVPGHLTESKWGRSALPHPTTQHSLKTVPWTWNQTQDVAIPSGARAFRKTEYSHGGLSLQECCIPRIRMEVSSFARSATPPTLALEKESWLGLRYKATLTNGANMACDIRTKANDPATSVLSKPSNAPRHLIKENHTVSLLVEDDSLEGTAAFFVVEDGAGNVTFKHPVTIAE